MKTNLVRCSMLSFPLTVALVVSTNSAPVAVISNPARTNLAGAGPSFAPLFSADGQSLVFVSAARNLVAAYPPSPYLDVMIHYPAAHATRTVSLQYPTGGGGNGDSSFPGLSSNAQLVVFASEADNLLPPLNGFADTNQASDVFIRDLERGLTMPVSVNTAGTGTGNGASTAPLLSSDGRWVVFESSASDLVAGDTNSATDIFRRDLWSNVTVLVSTGIAVTNLSTIGFTSAAMTPDASRVAFVGWTTNLVSEWRYRWNREVYLRDVAAGTTYWASRDAAPYFADSTNGYHAYNPALSPDGRFVAFLASSGSIPMEWQPGILTNALLFLFDSGSAQLVLVSSNAFPGCSPGISSDSRYLAYEDGTNVWRWDRQLGTNQLVSITMDGLTPTNGLSRAPLMSPDGQRILFYSTASGLVTNEVNGLYQLYLRDFAANSSVLLTRNRAGAASEHHNYPASAAWSPDGTQVAFDSPADDLVEDDRNQASDVFLCQIDSGVIELVSRRAGADSNTSVTDTWVWQTSVSRDGQTVLFGSHDSQFVAGDTNNQVDAFVGDSSGAKLQVPLLAGTTLMGAPALSGNGRFVAYGQATNSYSRFSGEIPAQFRRFDLQSGEVTVLTDSYFVTNDYYRTNYAGPRTNLTVWRPVGGYGNTNVIAISRDGTKVAFEFWRRSGTWIYQGQILWIYDCETGLGTAADTNYYNLGIYRRPLSFSPDGQWLAYSVASNSTVQIRLFNLADGRRRVLTGFVSDSFSTLVFSGDSRYAVFHDSEWPTTTRILRHDLLANESLVVLASASTNCYAPSVSHDGRWLAYLRRGAPSSLSQALVKDIETGAEQVVSVNYAGTGEGNGTSQAPAISPDGRYVIFASAASDLVPGDTNKRFDIFLRDRLLGTTTCLSINQQGVPAYGSSANPILSGDGRTVVFQSTASDLVYADYNLQRDIFAVRIGHDDTDGDGLDDDWELAYFEGLDHDGTADSDADGSSDRAEFLASTDPTNTGSVLRATTLIPEGGGNTAIIWQAVPGRSYQVQFKNSLNDTDWSVLPGTVTATTVTGVMVDTTASGKPHRFYRVMLAP